MRRAALLKLPINAPSTVLSTYTHSLTNLTLMSGYSTTSGASDEGYLTVTKLNKLVGKEGVLLGVEAYLKEREKICQIEGIMDKLKNELDYRNALYYGSVFYLPDEPSSIEKVDAVKDLEKANKFLNPEGREKIREAIKICKEKNWAEKIQSEPEKDNQKY
ncbi:hypothetical protein H1Q59_01230 [Holosporaceae bacterium 'Namur']|nr:hypothetical protein [Holosporaceae bacterium 'Namur']